MAPDWDVSDDRVSSDEWRLLERAFGEPLRTGNPDTLHRAVEMLRDLRKMTNADVRHDARPGAGRMRSRSASARAGERRSAHGEALAALFARYATDDRGVTALRREALGDQLIDVAEVESWLRAQSDLPRNAQGEPTVPFRVLPYGVPGCDTTLHLVVPAEGPLSVLADLSERLAHTYSWNPGEATLFVLSGYVPALNPIRITLREDRRLRARSRITLVVDPTCTPTEVAAQYRRRRSQAFGRTRRLTPKLAKLAHFTIEHDHLDWPHRMDVWNASWSRSARYKDVATFRRDCEQALTRLRDLRLPKVGRRQSSS